MGTTNPIIDDKDPRLSGDVLCQIEGSGKPIARRDAYNNYLGGDLDHAPKICMSGQCKTPCYG